MGTGQRGGEVGEDVDVVRLERVGEPVYFVSDGERTLRINLVLLPTEMNLFRFNA